MRYLILLLLITSAPSLQSQSFRKNGMGRPLTFKEMQLQFDQFRKTHDLKTEKHWKHFKRFEADMVLHTNGHGEPDGFKTFVDEAIKSAEEKARQSASPSPWYPIGPNAVPQNLLGYAPNGIGRINCFAFHPTDTNTYYVGVAQGGVWKTTNHGVSYTPLTDNVPITRISDICIDPNNANTIYISVCDFEYVGTGLYIDGRKRNTHYGLGVYKSTDGGNTWNATGLTFQLTNGDASLIRNVLVNPANSSQLLACGVSGMYRSTNGGSTWTKQLDSLFWDMVQDPVNPSVIYAATGWVQTSNIGSAAIYKSTDFGSTWVLLNTGIPPTGTVQRIKLAVAPTNTNYIYALCCDDVDGYYGVYQSTNAGITWTFNPGSANILEWGAGSSSGGQGTYDLALCVSHTNENVLFAGGINIWGSYDGGASFYPATHWTFNNGQNTIHADVHMIKQQPVSNHFFVATDGGLYKTSKIDTGNWNSPWTTNWTDLSNGMQITSFYRISSSRNTAERLAAGAQDNSTFYRSGNAWSTIFGGDGMDNHLSPYASSEILAASQYGNFFFSSTGGTSGMVVGSNPNFESSEWVTPVVADHTNMDVLYIGNENLVRSTDGGQSWTALGTIFTNTTLQTNTEISALAVSPANNQVIYAARRVRHEFNLPGMVFRTVNGGSNFVRITSNLPDTLYFTSLDASPTASNEAVISMAGFAAAHKVYKTVNGGTSWTNLTYNLPNVPVNCVKYLQSTGKLMVATDLGIYVLDNGATTWTNVSNGLPNVIVSDIEINPAADKLYIATFGRGIWESALSAFTATAQGTGLQRSAAVQDFKVYPTFGSGNITLETNGTSTHLSVIDVMGRIVYSSTLKTERTELNLQLVPGSYYLKVTDASGSGVRKIIIE
jgi:hypothetical protein